MPFHRPFQRELRFMYKLLVQTDRQQKLSYFVLRVERNTVLQQVLDDALGRVDVLAAAAVVHSVFTVLEYIEDLAGYVFHR